MTSLGVGGFASSTVLAKNSANRISWFSSSLLQAIDNADSQSKGPAAIIDFRRGIQALTTVASGSIAGATTSQLTTVANDTFANSFTFTRASTGTYVDANGVTQTAAIDEPRFSYINGARQFLVEGASTNYIKNSDTTGAVVGVIGSGGSLPTGWAISAVSGITFEVVSKGTEFGLPYVDIRTYGVNNSGSTAFPNIALAPSNGGGANVASTTEAWTGSAYVRLLPSPIIPSGTFGGLQLTERNSSGTFLQATTLSIPPTSTIARRTVTKNGGLNASTTQMTLSYFVSLNASEVVDFTIRYYAPQLEQLPFASSYILTNATAVTRAADSVLFSPKLLALINRQDTTVVLKGQSRGLQPAGVFINTNNGALMRHQGADPSVLIAGDQITPSISSIGVNNTLPGPYGATLAYGSLFRGLSVNNSTTSTLLTNTLSLGYTAVYLGQGAGGNAPGYFWADQLVIYPFRATNAEIQRLASVYV